MNIQRKIGDNAKIKNDLITEQYYDHLYMNPKMKQYCGKTLTIKSIHSGRQYTLNNCCSSYDDWYWTDEMLEPVNESTNSHNWTVIILPDKHDSDTTTAILKIDGKTERAETVKRYKKDTYNRDTAIKMVIDKLFASKPKPESIHKKTMFGDIELKVGDKFILKPWSKKISFGINECIWNAIFNKIMTISELDYDGEIFRCADGYAYKKNMIDRIIK